MEKRLVIVTLQFVLMTLGKLSVKNVAKNVKNTINLTIFARNDVQKDWLIVYRSEQSIRTLEQLSNENLLPLVYRGF